MGDHLGDKESSDTEYRDSSGNEEVQSDDCSISESSGIEGETDEAESSDELLPYMYEPSDSSSSPSSHTSDSDEENEDFRLANNAW